MISKYLFISKGIDLCVELNVIMRIIEFVECSPGSCRSVLRLRLVLSSSRDYLSLA